MSKSIKNSKILSFSSSSQQKAQVLLSSKYINNYSNKGFESYIKNKSKKNLYKDSSKTNKSNNNINNCPTKFIHSKTFVLETNKKEDNNKNDETLEKSTSKIDYRHFKKYPIKEILSLKNIDNNKEQLYWLVTYDKLIKSKNIIKILNYEYIDKKKEDRKPIYAEANLKIKTLKIPKFEIFFVKGYDKPFARPTNDEDSFMLTKLYLLNINEINKIVNFINRTDDKINIDKYISTDKKFLFQYIDIKSNIDDNEDINYPYCLIYYLGKFMNISMFLFTNTFNDIKAYNLNNEIIYSLPSSKKLYKFIKIIIKTFPEYNINYIINNIIKIDLYTNTKEKKEEILKYLSILKQSVPNKFLLNKVLRETIAGIQTISSISVSSPPLESSSQLKTSEELKNSQKISVSKPNNTNEIKKSLPKDCKFEIKSSLNSMNNNFFLGQYNTNYLSTNHTMIPSNSIRTFSNKNSVRNNVPLITIPYEINNMKRDTYGNSRFISKNIFMGLMPKKNIEPKKISSKNAVNRLRLRINEDKENINININNLFNRKKEDNICDNKKNFMENNNHGLYKNRKIDKKKGTKEYNKNEYTTPKKRKKIKYYK